MLNEDYPIGGPQKGVCLLFFLDFRLSQQCFLDNVVQLVSHVGDFRPRQFLDGAAAWCIAQKHLRCPKNEALSEQHFCDGEADR